MGTIKGHTFECIPNSHVFHLVPFLGKYDQLVLIKVSSFRFWNNFHQKYLKAK